MRKLSLLILLVISAVIAKAQDTTAPDTIPIIVPKLDTPVIHIPVDTPLRIININPFFSVHVDSTVNYRFEINKHPANYFWYLRNAPVGVKLNKENGVFSFKADKAYFLSGRLKYDFNYNVNISVQNLTDPKDKIDTSFTIVFFSTEILPSLLKPTVSGTVFIDEGQTLSFRVFCETGSFPIENILTSTNAPIGEFTPVTNCGDEFKWTPSYDFVKDNDSGKVQVVQIKFVGSTKFKMQDTTTIRLIVKNTLNYPIALLQYNQLVHEMNSYILKLKFTFITLDRNIKKTKRTRTTFDLTAASTALTGTVLATSKNDDTKRTGLILPSVGLILTPLKEASAPTKTAEQNQATLIRSSIKRMEYVLSDNRVLGDKDPELSTKINKLKEEFKQSQMQLIDVPIEVTNNMTEEELNKYFNSMKVNKNYRLKK